mgnify:CR=1 FL=1
MTRETNATEGWTRPSNVRKWHYYRGLRSLCGKWMLFVHAMEGYEVGEDDHSENCAGCKRARLMGLGRAALTNPVEGKP